MRGRGRSTRLPGYWLGVDIGATKVRAGAVSPGDGRVIGHARRRLEATGVADVVRAIEELSDHLRGSLRLGPWRGVGVAVAAQVDSRRGVVLHAPNLGWRDEPLARTLRTRLGAEVVLENDVRAAMAGERWRGRAKGVREAVAIVIGTGVGGAIVSDGRLLRGARAAAGELGHLTVVVGGRRCSCGNQGCLEAYVGGWAISKRAKAAAQRNPRRAIVLRHLAGGSARIDAASVLKAASRGDPFCGHLLEETFGYLAAGAVGVTNLLNPSLILLGGGVSDHWPGLPRRLEAELRSRCQPPAAMPVRVLRMGLGPLAPVVGAVRFASASLGPTR